MKNKKNEGQKTISVGVAIIFSVAAIIVAAIIAGAIVFSSVTKTARDINFEELGNFEILLQESTEGDSIQIKNTSDSSEQWLSVPFSEFSFVEYPSTWLLQEGDSYKGTLVQIKLVAPDGDPATDYISVSSPIHISCEELVSLPGHNPAVNEACYNGFLIHSPSTNPEVQEVFMALVQKLK